MRDLGERIKRERITWGMTQDDLADATGIARDKISKIEIGVRQVDADELPAFARVFEASVDELVHGPKMVVYDRIEPGRPDTDEARAWFARCIDNSLFIRRILGIDAG